MRPVSIVALVGFGAGCAAIADLRDDPQLIAAEGGAGATGGGAVGGDAGGTAGMCDLLDREACSGSAKCTVVDVDTGEVGCARGGTQGAYEVCQADAECEAGTYCGPNWGSCRPFCNSDIDCDGGNGRCEFALGPDATADWKVCVAMCDPVVGGGCGTGTACGQLEPNHRMLWECFATQALGEGQVCDGTFGVCADQLTCHQGTCRPYCYLGQPPPGACTCQDVLGEFSAFAGQRVGVCL